MIDENLAEVLDRRLPQVPQDTEETIDEELTPVGAMLAEQAAVPSCRLVWSENRRARSSAASPGP